MKIIRYLWTLVLLCAANVAFADSYVTVNTGDQLYTAIATNHNPFIRLGADFTGPSRYMNPSVNTHLDLNGHTLTYQNIIDPINGITFTVEDLTTSQSGKVVGTNGCFISNSGGVIVISGGTFTSSGTAAILDNESGQTLTINGGSFTTTNAAAHVIDNNGTLNIAGGLIIGADGGKAPVYINWNGTVNVTNGAICAGNSIATSFEKSSSGGTLNLPSGYQDGGAVVIDTKWAKPNTYYINYILSQQGNTTPLQHVVTKGSLFKVASASIVGYDFKGWYSKSDFSDMSISYISASNSNNFTLYGKLQVTQRYVDVTDGEMLYDYVHNRHISHIRLAADFTGKNAWTGIYVDTHLDLNSHTLTYLRDFCAYNGSTLTIEDLSTTKTGKAIAGASTDFANNNGGGTIIVNGGKFESSYNCETFSNLKDNTMTINGGYISVSGTGGYAISSNGTLNITGGTIVGADGGKAPIYANWAGVTTVTGGALYAGNSTTNVFEKRDGCQITLPSGKVDGGAIVCSSEWAISGSKSINYFLQLTGNTTNLRHFYPTGTAYTLSSPTVEGYKFDGWYTTSDFSGSVVTQIPASSTSDYVLYGKFSISNVYTVVTNGNELYDALVTNAKPNIRLGADFTSNSIVHYIGGDITGTTRHLDLNGHALVLSKDLSFTNGANFAIQDLSAAKTGSITANSTNWFIYNASGATFALEGGKLASTYDCPIIYNNQGATTNISGGSIQNTNTASRAIENMGTLNISGGTIIGADGGLSPVYSRIQGNTTMTAGAVYAGNCAHTAFETVDQAKLTLPTYYADGGAVVTANSFAIPGTKFINYIYPAGVTLLAAPHYYTPGTSAFTLPAPENSGMDFLGWSTISPSTTEDLIQEITTSAVKGFRIYPVWDTTTGIGMASASQVKAIGGVGEISILGEPNTASISIFTASGMLVSKGVTHFACPAGLYIVKVGSSITKILVR